MSAKDDADSRGIGLVMIFVVAVAVTYGTCNSFRTWDICRQALKAGNNEVAKQVCH